MNNQTKITISTEIVISDESNHVVSVVAAERGASEKVLEHHLGEASRIISANLLERLPGLAHQGANDNMVTTAQSEETPSSVPQLSNRKRKTRSDAGKPRPTPRRRTNTAARVSTPALSGMTYKKSVRQDIIDLREQLRDMDVKSESNKQMPLPSTKALEVYIDTVGDRDKFMSKMLSEGYSDVTARQGWFRASAYIPVEQLTS